MRTGDVLIKGDRRIVVEYKPDGYTLGKTFARSARYVGNGAASICVWSKSAAGRRALGAGMPKRRRCSGDG
jgi:hypothetical protein